MERAERLDGQLDQATVAQVMELAEAAAGTDGTYPLSEDAVLRVRSRTDRPVVHLLVRDGAGRLAGYAGVADETAEVVVHPQSRDRGAGHALVTAALEVVKEADPRGRLRVWAHGDHPAAAALARSLGFRRARVLHQLRRSLLTPVPAPVLPEGVTLRTFRTGEDERAWLAVNARAFADHPEQGRWTLADLRLRQAEPWFDPAGFLLAVRPADGATAGAPVTGQGERLLGFHWTKVHSPALGEVYVLGVDPDAQGLGLGGALTLAGLRYLRGLGLTDVMLYVDGDNTAAMRLYTGLGFAAWSTDVQYSS